MPDFEHPALAGRARELGALAESVRRLAALTVTTAADPVLLRSVVVELDRAAERLTEALPDVPLPRFAAAQDRLRPTDALGGLTSTQAMPFDMVMGPYNPIAPPVLIDSDPGSEPGLAIGRVTFGRVHEGAPGCVHGGAIAGVFDIVLTVANRLSGAAGPTTRLELGFRRPTLLDAECIFEASVVALDERRVTSHGRLVQNGEVTVEAEGRFAVFTQEQVWALGQSRAGRGED